MVVHFEVPRKVSAVGYYVNTACGADVFWGRKTAHRGNVTCRSCQRTRAFKFPPDALLVATASLPNRSTEER